jgi:hypothetical protein
VLAACRPVRRERADDLPAATFDERLAAYGTAVASEARDTGSNVLLGPAVDIARVPQQRRDPAHRRPDGVRQGLGAWVVHPGAHDEIDDDRKVVIVHRVQHRRVVYRPRWPRRQTPQAPQPAWVPPTRSATIFSS